MFDFIMFGIVDNAVMIFGAFTGYEVEKYLPKRFQLGHLMPIVGAGIGNTVSDFSGGAVTGSWELAFGTGIGCLVGLLAIPVFAYVRNHLEELHSTD
jgi:hypothetical protein